MIIAAAQTSPKRFDIEANLADHYKMVELAAQNQADIVLFPELSITGYEREKAAEMYFEKNDQKLSRLKALSVQSQITIVAGAPIKLDEGLFIGVFIIKPDGTTDIYTKQYLHGEENLYFISTFDRNPLLDIKQEKVAFAICADTNHEKHAEAAKKKGATLYMPGIFFEPEDMAKAYRNLAGYASAFELNILMSNFTGHSWGFESGGKSAFWNASGQLVAQLNAKDPGLLLIENKNGVWAEKASIYT